MGKIYMISIVLALIIGCEKDDSENKNACNSDNPIEDISWLKELKNSLSDCVCEISLIQGTYDNRTVFFTALTDPLCDGIDMPTLFDCKGNVVRTFTMNDYQEFYTDVTRDKVLYRCKISE